MFLAAAGLRSDTGEISIFRILRFSSSAIGLTDLLLGIGDVEPWLEAALEMLRTLGFRTVSLPRRLALCAARLPGEVAGCECGWRLLLLSSLSSSSAVSEATDI